MNLQMFQKFVSAAIRELTDTINKVKPYVDKRETEIIASVEQRLLLLTEMHKREMEQLAAAHALETATHAQRVAELAGLLQKCSDALAQTQHELNMHGDTLAEHGTDLQRLENSTHVLDALVGTNTKQLSASIKEVKDRVEQVSHAMPTTFNPEGVLNRIEEVRRVHAEKIEELAHTGIALAEYSTQTDNAIKALQEVSHSNLDAIKHVQATFEAVSKSLDSKQDADTASDLYSATQGRINSLADDFQNTKVAVLTRLDNITGVVGESLNTLAGKADKTELDSVLNSFNANLAKAISEIKPPEQAPAFDPSELQSEIEKIASTVAKKADADVVGAAIDEVLAAVAKTVSEIKPPEQSPAFDPTDIYREIKAVNEAVERKLDAPSDPVVTAPQLAKAISEIRMPDPVDLTPLTSVVKQLEDQVHKIDEEYITLDQTAEVVRGLLPAPVEPFDPSGIEARIKEVIDQTASVFEIMEKRIEERAMPADIARAVSEIRIPEPVVAKSTIEVNVSDIAYEYNEEYHRIDVSFKLNDSEHACSIPVPTFGYVGVWDLKKNDYVKGDIVTHDGSLWLAKKDSPGRPLVDTLGWKLIVKGGAPGKNGKDGKDGRSVLSYDQHVDGNAYTKGDFLHAHGRIWQCGQDTKSPPEGAQISSSDTWILLGYRM